MAKRKQQKRLLKDVLDETLPEQIERIRRSPIPDDPFLQFCRAVIEDIARGKEGERSVIAEWHRVGNKKQ